MIYQRVFFDHKFVNFVVFKTFNVPQIELFYEELKAKGMNVRYSAYLNTIVTTHSNKKMSCLVSITYLLE